MNWSRGLFRLWLVASIIWIAAVLLVRGTFGEIEIYLIGQYRRTDVAADELSVSPVKEGIFTVAFEGLAFEIDTGGVQPSDTDKWSQLLMAAALEMNKSSATYNARLRKSKAAALAGIAFAALPPLFVLALGTSLLWAVRGFSSGRK
jgi:hypothetical protein